MFVAIPGMALAWFARGKGGYRRVFRYLLVAMHLFFLGDALAFRSTEHRLPEEPRETKPMDTEVDKALVEECAGSKDPLCGLERPKDAGV